MSINIEEELKIVGQYTSFGKEPIPKFNTPITPKENFRRFMKRENPLWMPCGSDISSVSPRIIPDNVARGMVIDLVHPFTKEQAGGKGWFDLDWEFVQKVGGAMVRPGTEPLLDGIENWRDVIKFPDLDALDWEGSSRENAPLYADHEERMVQTTIYTGLFERLISFMGFEGAALALIDEDEQEYVHQVFDALCKFYDELIERFQKYYKVSYICFHDDWGSQRAPFFSLDTVMEMIVPYLKRVAESCHKRGIFVMLHSCGKNEMLVPAMIAAGVDAWSGQPMNDKKLVMDKYGDKLFLSEGLGRFEPNAPSGAQSAAADAYIEKYGDYCKTLICNCRAGGEEGAEIYRKLYSFTRKLYANAAE